MELLGKMQGRQIFYTHIITDKNWFEKLPSDNWIVFTIGDEKEAPIEKELVKHCLENNVRYTCSAGQLAESTEHEFDLEIINRTKIVKNGTRHDQQNALSTTSHKNFSEGFWFAATLAHDPYKKLDTLVCADFTSKGVKQNLEVLLEKINSGWLPPDDEVEEPKYDQ